METIPLASQDITEREVQAVVDVLHSERLSLGPQVQAFEAACAKRANRKYGIAVNSGTSGLHLCIRSLGIGPGDEVITTPFSFVATTNCILFEGATPVFVDIDPETYNMDPDRIESAITPRTRAILPASIFGNTAHFDQYEAIAKKHGLALIEDSCEAMGGSLNGRPAGSFGDCSVFGFYPNKQITTGEGGVIVTDREDIRDQCVSMRNQGVGKEGGYVGLGYNYRMSEIAAALGVAQMGRLDHFIDDRRRIAKWYTEEIQGMDGLRSPILADPECASWFVYVVQLTDRFTSEDRNAIVQSLREKGIGCATYFPSIHLQPHLRELLGTKEGDFPRSEFLSDRGIALPFHGNLSPENVKYIVAVLTSLLSQRNQLNGRSI